IDHSLGIMMKKRIGPWVDRYEALAMLYVRDKKGAKGASKLLKEAITIEDTKPKQPKLIYDVII
ncbi:MAG: pyrimidine-nucleoside phosphorylase, partial [Clostridiales bacterium]|nr:pyrimidine-nucleoside phosphorylase [Clostridiales bacterium]